MIFGFRFYQCIVLVAAFGFVGISMVREGHAHGYLGLQAFGSLLLLLAFIFVVGFARQILRAIRVFLS